MANADTVTLLDIRQVITVTAASQHNNHDYQNWQRACSFENRNSDTDRHNPTNNANNNTLESLLEKQQQTINKPLQKRPHFDYRL
jgi:hypothetical protein